MKARGGTQSRDDAATAPRKGKRRLSAALALIALCLLGVAVASAAQRSSRVAPSELNLTPGVDTLSASWDVTGTSGLAGFRVRWRQVGSPRRAWGQPVDLGPNARSYSLTGLNAAIYEVRVRVLISATRHSVAKGKGKRIRSRSRTVKRLGAMTAGVAMALAPPDGGGVTPKEEVPGGAAPGEKTKEQPKEEPKQEQPKEAPKEKEPVKEKERLKEKVKREKERPAKEERPKEEEPVKEAPKEAPKEEAPKEAPKEQPKEEPKQEQPKEAPKEQPKEEAPKEEAPKEEAPAKEEKPAEAPGEEQPAPACTLYGSASGNDANKGTEAAPLKTIHALLAKLTAGQTGCLLPGNYEALTTRSGESHGAAGAPVTITSADPQNLATVSGRMVANPGADWLTFSHLDFTDSEAKYPSISIGSAHTTWSYDDVTAPHTICFEISGAGQYGPGEDTLLEHLRVHNCGQPYTCDSDSKPCNEPPNDGYFIHGLYDLGVRTTVRNSYFYEVSSKGILLRGSRESVIEHNVIDDNGSGVLFGDLTPEDDTVRWNIITNSKGVCKSCLEYYGIWTGGSIGAGNSATNNDVFGNVSGNFGPRGSVRFAENIEVDPKFVNAAAHDYTLQLDSPALGYGPE